MNTAEPARPGAALPPTQVSMSVTYTFEPDQYLEHCQVAGETPSREGFRTFLTDYMLDDPLQFLPASSEYYDLTFTDENGTS